MSDFVEQCREEWRRLGVPDSLADEMAADLASDLREAQAEGVSAQELLGATIADPRSFAGSWAAERGIIPTRATKRRRPIVLATFTVLAAITLVASALLLLTGEPKVSLVKSRSTLHGLTATSGPHKTTRLVVDSVSASAPTEWILLIAALVALAFATWLWLNWRRTGTPIASTS